MNIDLCFHIFKFERRFRWVLSSINQQINNKFDLHIKIAACSKQDNFFPCLETSKSTFSKLDITINDYSDDRFNARGKTRTDNIENCKSEWLLFLDGDNVFHPQFFSNLEQLLTEFDNKNKRKLTSVPRLTMDAKAGYNLVDHDLNFSKQIENAYEKTSLIKTHPSFGGRVSGAGYFQLVHTPTMRQMGIDKYVIGLHDTSILDKNTRFCTKSDVVFRKKFDGVYPIRNLPPLIHINHHRRKLDEEYSFNKCN